MHKLLLGITIAAALLGGAQKGDRAELQLQAAINKEVVEGDLKGAIEQYRKVAQSANRTTAAKALVRMGQCYERLGDAEARKAYERVVRDFADQKDPAAEARTRLATLGGPDPHGPASVTMRRLSEGNDPDDEGAPSPDGQWMSYTTIDGGLGLYNLASGARRLLKAVPADSRGFVEESIWSPDGKQIAYGWDYCGPDCVELRVIQPDGSGDRTLYRNDKLDYVYPWDWSPDGKCISAVLIAYRKRNDLALIDAHSGTARVLKTFPPDQQPGKVMFSPDGRHLAYDAPQNPGEPNRDVWLMSLDGSQIPLVQNPANDRMLAWLPEGLLFASDRSGTMDIWLQPVADGKSKGPAQRLKAGIGNLGGALGLTRKGSLYYSVVTAAMDIFTATLDPVSGKVTSRPTPVSQRHAGLYGPCAWSPDGKRLASMFGKSAVGPFQSIALREMESAEERDLNTGFLAMSANWNADGRTLLVAGMSKDKREGLFRLDPGTGDSTLLVPADNRLQNPQPSPDGKTVFYTDRPSGKYSIVGLELASGNKRIVLQGDDYGWGFRFFALSPDGEQIAFADEGTGRLMLASTKGGPARQLYQTKPDLLQRRFGVTWSPDGRYVLFAQKTDQKSPFQLWRVAVQGGKPEYLDLAAHSLIAPRVRPDGKSIAFSSGKLFGNEIWVLENFLPAAHASR